MKILYAIQGTGNGHLSRANVIIPLLQKYGEVDVLVSSGDHDLPLPIQAKYQFAGLGFTFGKSGGINYWKSFWRFKIIRFLIDMYRFPVDEYDVIINDFEPLTAWKCKMKKKKIIGLSHHSAYLSNKVPRPKKKDWFTEMVLKYHSPCSTNFSFHFKEYDKNIFTPIIRDEIRNGINTSSKNIVVYLPSVSADKLIPCFEKFSEHTFIIFCKHTKTPFKIKNIEVVGINYQRYISELLASEGVICNAGFESPAESIYLGKKLLCITMKGQYEQRCNAEALKQMGVFVIDQFNENFAAHLSEWFNSTNIIHVNYPDNTAKVIHLVMKDMGIPTSE